MKVIIIGIGHNVGRLQAVKKALKTHNCEILMIDNKPRLDVELIAEQLRMPIVKSEAFPKTKSKYHK